MSEPTYRDAWAALVNFTQSFAAPMLAIVPVLEKAKDAEEYLATLQPQIDAKLGELEAANLALVQAKADRESVLNAIEHDRMVKQDDANRHLEAYRQKIQAEIDGLSAARLQEMAQNQVELANLKIQIEDRLQVQRDLDAAIQTKRQIVADLTGTILRASHVE